LADGKTYALKRVNIENMSQKELDDTLNEIRFLASFKHPRLVRWYETFLGTSTLHGMGGEGSAAHMGH
jgi:NIMA (never in mitosis gene a)-related kinase